MSTDNQTPIEWAMEIATELTADEDTGALLRDAGTSVIQHLLAEVIAQRAIIEGSTTPPTDAELVAHKGWWRAVWSHLHGGGYDWLDAEGAQARRDGLVNPNAFRWWPIDRNGRPCARPVTP